METIYPVHSFDGAMFNRQFRVLIGLRFAHALDPERLETSLNKLLTADEDWLKLTGRLRMDKYKKLELHIPSSFSAARPPARFSLDTHPYPLAECPLAKFLPAQGEEIQITVDPERYRSLYQSKDIPQSFQAYLQGDVPVLTVHVTCFSDATFIGVLLPHVIADAASFGLFFQAWADVLNEKPAPKLVSYKEDRMAQSAIVVRRGETPAVVERFALPWLQEMIFIFWVLVNIIRQWHIKIVDIYIPAKAIRKWREECMAELGGAWISEGDVLTAWLIQRRMPDLRRDVSAWIIADVRGRLPLVPKNYFGNAVIPTIAYLKERKSVAQIAHAIRNTVVTQTDPEELGRAIDFANRYRKDRGRDGVVAVAGTEPYVLTNWVRAALLSADFRGALPDGVRDESAPLLPVGAVRLGFAAIPVRNMGWILYKDQKGGYMIQCQVPASDFDRFKADVMASGSRLVEADCRTERRYGSGMWPLCV